MLMLTHPLPRGGTDLTPTLTSNLTLTSNPTLTSNFRGRVLS